MRRHFLSAFLLLFGIASIAYSQIPTDGQVGKTSYENTYFKFSYSWPAFLQPYGVNALQLPKSTHAYEFLLFSARQGNDPDGIVIIAERMKAQTQLKSSSAFMDWIARFGPGQHVTMQPRKHFINADGFVIDELDYTEDGVPSSALVIQIREFLIAFKCNAKSASDLDAMNRSIADLRRLK